MMKKIKAAGLALTLLAGFSVGSVHAASAPVDISVNGSYILTEVEPIIKNGTVLAPVRAVSNALGCQNIYWDEKSKTATVASGANTVKIKSGSSVAEVNGAKKKLAVPAEIVNGRILVPIRFTAENFGADVEWNPNTYTVRISLENYDVASEHVDTSYTSDELFWLARIIHAEAQGEVMDGKIGVGNVVLNRVDSNDYANTIYGVIFDRKNGVQFTPISNGAIYNNPGKDSYLAAKSALKGANTVGESLFFCNPKISTNFWIVNNRKYYTTIGEHDFYL